MLVPFASNLTRVGLSPSLVWRLTLFVLGHLAILLSGTPKPKACWSDRSYNTR